jgi:hypothetical protein
MFKTYCALMNDRCTEIYVWSVKAWTAVFVFVSHREIEREYMIMNLKPIQIHENVLLYS